MRTTGVLWASVAVTIALLGGGSPATAGSNCSILTGGNPCNAGCPDECSPILCPGNALCLSKCGGSGCNVGCSPGPCGNNCPNECSPILCPGNALCMSECGGSGCNIGCSPGPCGNDCPDECSPILCPGNALCKSECGGNSCNLACSPGPCGAGCPNECSILLCPSNPCSCSDSGEFCIISGDCCSADLGCAFPQQVCAHSPRELGEPCGPLAPCSDELKCIGLQCQEPRKIGEGCLVGSDCADGLDCRACFVDGCSSPFMCFATRETGQIFSESECLLYHSDAVQRSAAAAGITLSFGYGSAAAVGLSGSFEVGTVYGQNGSYGCFLTTCLGGTTDAEIGSFVSVGFYTSFDDFQGQSVAIVEDAGEGLVFSTSQIIGGNGALIGTEDCLAIEASILPVSVGVYDCDTTVNSFSVEPPPTTTSTTLPVGFTTTSTVPVSTTSTTTSTLPTLTVEQLSGLLAGVLPNADPDEKRLRRFARKLTKTYDKFATRLAASNAADGRKCKRLRRKARAALRRMQSVARKAAKKDRLEVPPGPIETFAEALLVRIPPSCDDA